MSRKQQQQLTTCNQCYQLSSTYHQSRNQHNYITVSSLQHKLFFTQWQQQKHTIIETLQKLVEDVKDYLQEFDGLFDQYRVQVEFNPEGRIKPEEEETIFRAIENLNNHDYKDITCHQLHQLVIALDQSPHSRTKLHSHFKKLQQKVGSDLLQILNDHFPNTLKHSQQNNFMSQITTDKLKLKVQSILDDQILKLKPHIQQYIKKIQKQTEKRIPQRFSQKQQQQSRRSSTQYSTTSKQQQKNNTSSFVEVDQIRQTNGQFSTIVKVLSIIEKQMKVPINGRRCTQFLAGDQTGVAIFVFEKSPHIQQGNVLQITNCRTYRFHGDEQVQYKQKSQIKIVYDQINHIGEYRLSNHAKNLFDDNIVAIKKLMEKRDDAFSKKQAQNSRGYQNKQKDSRNNYDEKHAQRKNNFPQSKPQTRPNNIKIADIQPGDQIVKLNAQVIKIYKQKGYGIWFTLGDDTGLVDCTARNALAKKISQGIYVQLREFNSTVAQGYILLQPSADSTIQKTSSTSRFINHNNNISLRKINKQSQTKTKTSKYIDDFDKQSVASSSYQPSQKHSKQSRQYDRHSIQQAKNREHIRRQRAPKRDWFESDDEY